MPISGQSKKLLVRFGANVRQARLARTLTQERLAELVDLNPRTIQKIEAGQLNIMLTTAGRLQAALGADWSGLLGQGRS